MKKISKIKSSFFSRQLGMASILYKTREAIFDPLKGLEANVDVLVHELGMMKGSLMKAGQMLSLYAGPYLPEEAMKVLRKLENQSYFLEWDKIKNEIPLPWQQELIIDPIPVAAASLGQVHRAYDPKNKCSYAMKIQYQGVSKAVDNDIKALRFLLKTLKLLPRDIDLTDIFDEIREMMLQEMDYELEAENLNFFHQHATDLAVPEVISKYSSKTILTMSFLEGTPLREKLPELSQADRNRLGEELFSLFFRELFEWNRVQTDAHQGNFLLVEKEGKTIWGLLDFGAVKRAPEEFLGQYKELMKCVVTLNRTRYFQLLDQLGYLPLSAQVNRDGMWNYIQLIADPFQGGVYDWGSSRIPEEVLKAAPAVLKEIRSVKPPRHNLFIDRKVGGVFFIMKMLGSRFDPSTVIQKYL